MQKATLSVPETATDAQVHYIITPAHGRMKVYRTPNDQNPMIWTGEGDAWVPMLEPRTMYYDFLPETENFKVSTLGWRDPRTP